MFYGEVRPVWSGHPGSIFEHVCVCVPLCVWGSQTLGVHAHAAWSTDVHRAGARALNSILLLWPDFYTIRQQKDLMGSDLS